MHRPLALLVAALAFLSAAHAADLPPDVLAKSRWMVLTRADFDAALQRVPENARFEFASDPKRVKSVLNNLLVIKTLAAQAKAHGTKPAASGGYGAGSPAERALAVGELQRIEADAARSFDANKAIWETKAHEIYMLDRAKYQVPEEVRVSDIAVEVKDRGEEAALARAREAHAKLVAGADFATVAREYSDDPTTRDKGGALPFVARNRLAPSFAKGVFALTRIGEISEPIRGPTAWHIVRLDERRAARPQTFDEAKGAILASLKQRYLADQREVRFREINSDATLEVNQPAIDALVTHADPTQVGAAPPAKPGPEPKAN
jgi:parvulin-like peptidyl-prolyl isomerase